MDVCVGGGGGRGGAASFIDMLPNRRQAWATILLRVTEDRGQNTKLGHSKASNPCECMDGCG